MTKKQKALNAIQRKQSERRERHATLTAQETRTAEEQAELTRLDGELTAGEVEYRDALAAVEAEQEAAESAAPDAEDRARIELRDRCSFGRYLAAALSGKEPSGAELEYRDAEGVAGIPIALFERDRPAPAAEEHRDITPAPAAGTGVQVAPIQPYIFSRTIAQSLGIAMPGVGTGAYSVLRISTPLPAEPRAKGQDAPGTAGALTPETTTPRRISGRMSIAIEDQAAIGAADFDAALRSNVSMALSDAYDEACINGTGGAGGVEGLIAQLTDPTDPTAVVDFDAFIASFSDLIDGLWAERLMHLSAVVAPAVYQLAAKTFRGTAANGGPLDTVAAHLEKVLGGFRTAKRMPDVVATIGRGIVQRGGVMGVMTAVHPTWGSLAVDDIYSDSASGTRHFSIHAVVGAKVIVVQPDAYRLLEWKLSGG